LTNATRLNKINFYKLDVNIVRTTRYSCVRSFAIKEMGMKAEEFFRFIEWFAAWTIVAIAMVVPWMRHFKQQAMVTPNLFNIRQFPVGWRSYSSNHHKRIIRNLLSHASITVPTIDSGPNLGVALQIDTRLNHSW
jgi:hypothetical protein